MTRLRSRAASAVALAALFTVADASAADPNADVLRELNALKARIAQLESALAAQQKAQPATAAATPAATAAPAAAPAPNPALEQKVAAIERRLEVQTEEATAARLKTPNVAISDKGLAVTTPDGNFEMRARGYVQMDSRWWLGDNNDESTNTLLFRRVRPVLEGTVYKNFYYKLMPDFAGSSVTLQDGYAEWRQFPFARVAVGKMKSPVGIDRLQSAADLAFVERSISNNLVPNRDFGVTLNGDLFGERLNYVLGVFNGVQDLGSIGATDTNDDKDFEGRVFALPFKSWFGPLQGLGVGLAGTYGKEEFSTSSNVLSPNLGSYLTPGQTRFFRYRTTSGTATVRTADGKSTVGVGVPAVLASTTVADGDRYRIVPQAYWYWRQFGLLGDYVESSQEVAFGRHRDTLTNRAWSISGAWVLTGEQASYRGVRPRANFDPLQNRWGAVELVARYGELTIDPDAFDGVTKTALGNAFADPRVSARQAAAWGLGLNWYLNSNFKLNFDYEHTSFVGGGGGTNLLHPLDREAERVLMSRVQVAY